MEGTRAAIGGALESEKPAWPETLQVGGMVIEKRGAAPETVPGVGDGDGDTGWLSADNRQLGDETEGTRA